jgi:hypothetical protein
MTELYGPLGPLEIDHFRLISIEPLLPGQDSQSTLRCRLAHYSRADYASPPIEDPEDHSRLWPGAGDYNWNELGLFHPKSKIKISKPPSSAGAAERPQTDLSKSFVALSYVWGPPETPKKTVVINDCEIQIGENLHTALGRLRESEWVHRGIKVWADAMCINQGDLTEKGQHIRTMDQVYAEAWQVVIWLGYHNKHTGKAYGAITWLAREIGTEDNFQYLIEHHEVGKRTHITPMSIKREEGFVWTNPVYLALRDFFANPYWHRLWILQELAMSRADAPVICGRWCMTLRDIHLASKLINAHEDQLGSRVSSTSDVFAGPQSYIVSNDRQLGNPLGRPQEQWRRILRIMDVREYQHKGRESLAEQHTVISTLELARTCGATDSRDKVFGLLGIASIAQLTNITPDYYTNIKEIFTTFTEQMIAHGDLSMLRLVYGEVGGVKIKWTNTSVFSKAYLGAPVEWAAEEDIPGGIPSGGGKYLAVAPPCPHELPSWTVCLICPPAPLQFLLKSYEADRGLVAPEGSRIRRDGDILHVAGVFIDTVATLSAFNLTEADPSYPHNGSESIPNAYGDMSGLRDALWHTIVADSMGQDTGEPPEEWEALLSHKLWAAGSPYSPRTNGLEFSLGTFMQRNKHLMLCGHELNEIIFGESKLAKIKGSLDGFVTRGEKGLSEAKLLKARFCAANILAYRRVVSTRLGRIGLAVAAAQEGDSIAVLKGCGMPMVLRPAGGGLWRLVGECYVHGIMKGDVAESLNQGKIQMTEIALC